MGTSGRSDTAQVDLGVGPLDAGSILFADSSGNVTEDNANLFFDNTNDRAHFGPRGANAGTGVLNLYHATAPAIDFGTGAAAATMRISNISANVLHVHRIDTRAPRIIIGKTTQAIGAATLEVGTDGGENPTQGGIKIQVRTSTTGDAFQVIDGAGTGVLARFLAGGNLGIGNAGAATTGAHIQTRAATDVGLKVQGFTGQTGDLAQNLDPAGTTILSNWTADGRLRVGSAGVAPASEAAGYFVSKAAAERALVLRVAPSASGYALEIKDSADVGIFAVGFSGNVRAPDGNAAGPGMSFITDSDTGWYKSASNAMTASVGASGKLIISSAGITLLDAVDVVFNTGTGTKLGTATSQKLSLWNKTPIVQPSGFVQTYATADKTHADFTSADIGVFTGGVIGFLDAAERDNLRIQYNALRADVADLKQFVNAVFDEGENFGLWRV